MRLHFFTFPGSCCIIPVVQNTSCKEAFDRCRYEKFFEDSRAVFSVGVRDVDSSVGRFSGDDLSGV